MRLVVLTLSGMAIGGAASLVIFHLRDIGKEEDAIPFAMARAGFAIIVYLIGKLIAGLPEYPLTADGWWYFAGVTLAGIGYAWLAGKALLRFLRERRRRRGET